MRGGAKPPLEPHHRSPVGPVYKLFKIFSQSVVNQLTSDPHWWVSFHHLAGPVCQDLKPNMAPQAK